MNGKEDFFKELADRIRAEGYDVKEMTPYQYRVNGRLDLYPVNRRWHDIKFNRRGAYEDMVGFACQFFRNLDDKDTEAGTTMMEAMQSTEDSPIDDLWEK